MNQTFERNPEPSENRARIRPEGAEVLSDTGNSADRVTEAKTALTAPASAKTLPEQSAPLFSAAESQEFRSRWDAAQTNFVDEPRRSVQEVDDLVATVIKRLSDIFSSERKNLEGQWESGDNVSTEDLRLALQRYRSFFSRLLSI